MMFRIVARVMRAIWAVIANERVATGMAMEDSMRPHDRGRAHV